MIMKMAPVNRNGAGRFYSGRGAVEIFQTYPATGRISGGKSGREISRRKPLKPGR